MKRYKIIAEYHATVELEIEIDDDEADPADPGNWDRFISELQQDYRLWDVISTKEVEEF